MILTDRSDKIDQFWEQANKTILWGWKRDIEPRSRVVFFSGQLGNTLSSITMERMYFYYASKMPAEEAAAQFRYIEAAQEKYEAAGIAAASSLRKDAGLATIEFSFGTPSAADEDKVNRLRRRRPRRRIKQGDFPLPSLNPSYSELFPADVYVGSGISYEAGLPTLCDMHDRFGVDSEHADGFACGLDDPLPKALAEEGPSRIKLFASLHIDALQAQPTTGMTWLSTLQREGMVGRVFTDNVDNMLAKVGAEFERVRGSGVFNERHPVTFTNRRLIVIGVAADRRQIVQQARGKGLHVIVVNPCAKVSPNVTHLDYLRSRDTFFKMTFDEFVRGLLETSKRDAICSPSAGSVAQEGDQSQTNPIGLSPRRRDHGESLE